MARLTENWENRNEVHKNNNSYECFYCKLKTKTPQFNYDYLYFCSLKCQNKYIEDTYKFKGGKK